MVRVSSLLLLAAPCLIQASTSPIDMLQTVLALPREALKSTATKVFGMSPEKAEKLFTPDPGNYAPLPYALDLNDTNWDTVIRTGTYDPYARSLPTDTTWAILVYGQDAVSKVMADAFNNVTMHNSSESGGELPSNIRFARLNYGSETVLTTRWWMWKPPALVLANYNLRELRFFTPSHIPPFHVPMANLINKREAWETMPIWQTAMAPGGMLEPYMHQIADGWAWYHRNISKLPNFALLAISGFFMNFIVGWFHTSKPATAKPPKDEKTAQISAASGPSSAIKKGGAAKRK